MTKIVGVRFQQACKVYYFAPGNLDIKVGDGVIVETSRGVEYGKVITGVAELEDDKITQPLKPVLRIATEADEQMRLLNKGKEQEAFSICQEKIKKHNLDMKLVSVEYAYDGSKILFYFIADGRIDFRELVKDLASVFRTRIELRQIGVRDETKMKGKEQEAFSICQEKIKKHNLDMKLVSVEYAYDGSKILFYFIADGRIDFRELVKDLASVFRTRIELRQIGVRDETKMKGGIGICGRPLCCHTFLSDFAPVSIKMAKEQNLSLNPTKISGVCGRLMCCLKNEEETYEYLNSRLPSVGEYVTTPDGIRGEVQSVNVLRQKVKVLLEIGKDERDLQEFSVDDLQFKRRKRKDTAAEETIEESLEEVFQEEIFQEEEEKSRQNKPQKASREDRENRGNKENRGSRKPKDRKNRNEQEQVSSKDESPVLMKEAGEEKDKGSVENREHEKKRDNRKFRRNRNSKGRKEGKHSQENTDQ